VDFNIEDMRYFADRHRGKHKTSGPHWSLVNRFPVLFDEYERMLAYLVEIKKVLATAKDALEEAENAMINEYPHTFEREIGLCGNAIFDIENIEDESYG